MADKFEIHVYSPPESQQEEIPKVRELFDAGLDYFHLRKPNMPKNEYEDYILQLPDRYRPRIILHDFPDLGLKYGLGFQFNSRWPNYREGFMVTGRSCHSWEEISFSDSDFATLSPIFDSISKEGYQAMTKGEIPDVSHMDARIIALGGIDISKIQLLKSQGYSGAAFLGSVWNRKDGYAEMIKYLLMRNIGLQFITNAPDAQQTILQAEKMLDSGVKWVQIRMKDQKADVIAFVLRSLTEKVKEKNATLIVDDHAELAHLCHGVHLGQNDIPVMQARQQLAKEKIIGLTVNNSTHIAASREALPDYYGIGPLRYTTTKKNLAPVLGLEGYKALQPLLTRPFVAIGGICEEDVEALVQIGAAGVAVSGLLISSLSPQKTVQTLHQSIYEL